MTEQRDETRDAEPVGSGWRTRQLVAALAASAALVGPALLNSAPASSGMPLDPSTAAAAGAVVVWAVGDLCDDDNAPLDCDDVGRLIASDPETDAVLALGDLQYENGSLANFHRFYDPKMGVASGCGAGRSPRPETTST